MIRAPIRVRLTGWYVLVLALVMVALGAFVVTRLRTDLTAELDRTLSSAAGQIAHGYAVEGDKEFRDLVRTVLPGPLAHGSGAQLLAADGAVVLSEGDPISAAPLVDEATLGRAVGGTKVIVSRRLGSPAQHLRVVALPVTRRGKRQVVAVTESLATVDSSTDRVLVLLLIGGGAALVLVAVGGWWIAHKALMPVERITSRARRIGIDDLSERIAVPRVDDEVGRLARTLNEMLDRLEAGVDAQRRLVADASHELRAPLAATRSELEVSLRHDDLAPEARAVLKSARDEVVRMGQTVDNLLTLARVDEGVLELLVRPCDLLAVANAAARSHRAAAEAVGAHVVVEGEPVVLAADGERLQQVVSNLIDNAIRHSPPRGEVGVTVHGDGRLTVVDSGPGVPPEARERIFERFARQDQARGRDGGAGLGLAISREIVRAHGGAIRVDDADGGGSVFTISLPGAPLRPPPTPSLRS